ncbi:MAG: hypothetical protein D6769_00555, partial [Methanobacteriota archaeon]
MERLTKSKLIELKKKLKMLEESKSLLEERKKQLAAVRKKMILTLTDMASEYNKSLTSFKELSRRFMDNYSISELIDDGIRGGNSIGQTKIRKYLGKIYTTLDRGELAEPKGDSISLVEKRELLKIVGELLDSGGKLDEMVKRVKII